MTTGQIICLIAAAGAGGAINAVAGGGTLVTFPTLLLVGTPPVVANATSTLALLIGNSGGILGYRQHVPAVKPLLSRFLLVSLLGGSIGSVLLTLTSNRLFSKLVPFLILFATVLFLAQGLVRRLLNQTPAEGNSEGRVRLTIGFQFVVAVYGGYFGAGIGILMLALLGFIGLRNIHEMNTLKTVLGALINLVAAIWFILLGLIDWPKAALMTVGALAGYYLGSHYSQKVPQKTVRVAITAIGFTLSAITFYKEFVR